MLMICEECSCLFIEQIVSYNGSYAPKIHIFSSEFCDNVLLFDIVILILHISNALLTLILLTWTIWRAPTNASKWDLIWRLKG